MVATIQPRQKVEYKRPGRLNVVSVAVALVVAAGVYVFIALWPVISLRSNVEGELADALPNLWRNNLRPVETSSTHARRACSRASSHWQALAAATAIAARASA